MASDFASVRASKTSIPTGDLEANVPEDAFDVLLIGAPYRRR
jgi:hypothetical protein